MNDSSRKTLLIAVMVVAVGLAVWSGVRFFGGSGAASATERAQTKAGTINSMSSMFGPDANGQPRTAPPAGINIQTPPSSQ